MNFDKAPMTEGEREIVEAFTKKFEEALAREGKIEIIVPTGTLKT